MYKLTVIKSPVEILSKKDISLDKIELKAICRMLLTIFSLTHLNIVTLPKLMPLPIKKIHDIVARRENKPELFGLPTDTRSKTCPIP